MEELTEVELHELLEAAFANVKKSITLLNGQIATQQKRAMPQILSKVIPINAKTLLDSLEICRSAEPYDLLYLLYDINYDIIDFLPRMSKFLSKSTSFFASKFYTEFDLFSKRIYGYIQMVYILCTDCENTFTSRSMISDDDAFLFWNEYFGEDNYVAEYSDFKDAIKEKFKIEIFEDANVQYSPVVTAGKFGKETSDGFEPLLKKLGYENPFVYNSMIRKDTGDATEPDSDKEAAKRMDSKYFFIVSNLLTDSKEQLCITVKDKKLGSPVGLNKFDGSFEQQWKIDSKGCIINRATGYALDIGNRDIKPHKPIIQWAPDGSQTQVFVFGMDGTIRPCAKDESGENYDLCFDDDNGNTGPDSVIILYGIKPGNSNQMWTICPYVESKRKTK